MKNTIKSNSAEPLHILLIGNNPIELGYIIDKLNTVRTKRILTEIAFDRKTISERLIHFRPDYILIDDNIGTVELSQTIDLLCRQRKTKNTPITVLKNSNYSAAFISSCILDFMLKHSWSTDSIFIALKNSLRFRKMHHHLSPA